MTLNQLETVANASYVYAEVRPSTLLAMIALIRMQHEALVYCYDTEGTGLRSEALTAFEKFGAAE